MNRPFSSCAVVGVGLVGGSLGMALRASGRTVLGLDLERRILDRAVALGAIDGGVDLPEALSGSELVLVAVPPAQVVRTVAGIAPHLRPGAVVVDVASVKGALVPEAERVVGDRAYFVGSHPMFGTAGSGVGDASADLVRNAAWIFTPTGASDPLALSTLERLARELGMQPVRMRVDEHDRTLAALSHVPYLLSIALTRLNPRTDVAGPNFRGMTRVSQSPTALWREILTLNREALRAEVDRFCDELKKLSSLEDDALAAALEEAGNRLQR